MEAQGVARLRVWGLRSSSTRASSDILLESDVEEARQG